jgi:hypothetical protein
LPVLHAAAAATAILAVKGPSTSSKVRRRIRMLSLSGQGSLGDLGVYFYDYKYSPDQKNRRDYFIVPAQLMLGIAGYQDSAPAALRVRAESVATALHKSMSANGGVYLTEPQQRTSTKNQAWAAILLSLALTNPKLSRLGSRIWYGIRRERRPTWLTESVLPLLVLFLSISASVYFRDEGRWINTLTTVNVFFWSSVYGRVWVDRVFLGR